MFFVSILWMFLKSSAIQDILLTSPLKKILCANIFFKNYNKKKTNSINGPNLNGSRLEAPAFNKKNNHPNRLAWYLLSYSSIYRAPTKCKFKTYMLFSWMSLSELDQIKMRPKGRTSFQIKKYQSRSVCQLKVLR